MAETEWGKKIIGLVEATDHLASELMRNALDLKDAALRIKEMFKRDEDDGQGLGRGGGPPMP